MDSAILFLFFFSSRRRHTRCSRDWSSDVCSSDLHYTPFLHPAKTASFHFSLTRFAAEWYSGHTFLAGPWFRQPAILGASRRCALAMAATSCARKSSRAAATLRQTKAPLGPPAASSSARPPAQVSPWLALPLPHGVTITATLLPTASRISTAACTFTTWSFSRVSFPGSIAAAKCR